MAGKPFTWDKAIDHKRICDALVEGGSIRAAAELLGVGTPSLDNVIRRWRINWRALVGERRQAARAQADVEKQLRAEIVELRAKLGESQREAVTEATILQEIVGLKRAADKAAPPDWLIRTDKARGSPGVPTLFATDWHLGEVVDPTQIGGVNAYDLSIAKRRARTLVGNAVDLLKRHMVNPTYPGIVFAIGGDMLSGDIHEELQATNEPETMPALLEGYGLLSWCISALADEFGRVFVPAVCGNHTRLSRKPRAKGRAFTSFDWLLYQFLAKRFEDDKRIQFLIPNGPDALYRVFGHRYLLSHGDQFRGGDGIIGALGPIFRGDTKKRARNSAVGQGYDTLVVGHWHQQMQLRRCIVGGSLKGYDEYAYQGNFPFEPPQQALWMTHPDRGITMSMPVYVEAAPKASAGQGWVQWAA